MRLTKSRFLHGLWCPSLLWYEVNAPGELQDVDERALAIMEQGTAVGEFARTAFSGELVSEGAATRTLELLEGSEAIFEATFSVDELLCKVDVLRRTPDGWDVIEVKSSTRVKDEHLPDVAFQWHVLGLAGVKLHRAYVMHIDSSYVRNGAVDVHKLFTLEDVTEIIEEHLDTIEDDIAACFDVMSGPRPELAQVHLCNNPHGCPVSDFDDVPAHSVLELYRSSGLDFLEDGILQIADIEDGIGLTPKQRVQWKAVKSGEEQVDKKKLSNWLATLNYPLCHLDFETIGPAIPLFDGTRPYQQIPFQYSLHVETSDGSTVHHEFLGDGVTDPREKLLLQLIQDIPPTGRILAHNMSFEKRVLTELGQAYPEHEEWVRSVTSRLVDTIVPFRNFWYYHPEQHGSCSLKAVLPALTGNGYAELEVGDGAMAQIAYAKLGTDLDDATRNEIRNQLLTYCKLDTQAMVDIIRVLKEAAL